MARHATHQALVWTLQACMHPCCSAWQRECGNMHGLMHCLNLHHINSVLQHSSLQLSKHAHVRRGCGLLSTISAQCPALDSIDATFCGQLDGGGLERLVRAAPMLQTLLLSVCESVAPSALACLVHACHLRILDLSYTEIHV